MHLLRIPLTAKLVGANIILLTGCALIALALGWRPTSLGGVLVLGVVAVAMLLVTLALVILALRPLSTLEQTAHQVWSGDYSARVGESPLADRAMQRIGTTFNLLLDKVATDRQRLRELAADVIRAGDRERAEAARALHDSAAQSLAGISWQLAALTRDAVDTPWEDRLMYVTRLTQDVLDEVRFLAQTLHPRVLDDLGLAAALSNLARQAHEQSGITVTADVDPAASAALAPETSAALYRVAQDAIANAIHHGDPTTVTVRLTHTPDMTLLEVEDDGCGFDLDAIEKTRPTSSIFSLRERVALVDAVFSVESSLGGGTRVRAHISHTPVRTEGKS